MVLISADAMPTAFEELASSSLSSEMSIAKENRLSGESCSWKKKTISYSKLSVGSVNSGEEGDTIVCFKAISCLWRGDVAGTIV